MSDLEKIIPVDIEEQMKSAYIDYSMSVIVSRALPDVRDGLKPVHRRVLYGMNELGSTSTKPYKKSARIVGEVLGKFHPHGDSSVYFAMVRLAQEWSLRYPLIDGQGNFGSVDGDSPAAMRYTEARLRKLAEEMLADLDKNTVDFRPNFDETLQEPVVLPSKFPNLLVNGASGIAVGMATNMPPHNLKEVVDGIMAYIDNNDITIPELMKYIKAPDFPTGGTIYGYAGVKEAFETGRGKIVVRGKTEIETSENGREKLIITEIPYMVNKAELIIKIADLVNEKKIEGIANVNDESDRSGMRIVIDIKRDEMASVILNKLYKLTPLQTAFNVNNIALVHGRPHLLNLKDLIRYFVEHRHEVVIRRTKYELEQSEKKAHILRGLIIALDHLDAVIELIRKSKSPDEAREGLISNFGLDDIQAKAILDLRLQRLTGLERDKIHAEYDEICKYIDWLNEVLANESMRMGIIRDELLEIKEQFGDKRKTDIIYASEEFNPEDFYADDTMVITISHMGYIKRTPLSEFRTQARGGIGSKGSSTRDEDFLEHMFIATMHSTLLLFTEKGKCFWLRVFEIPEGTKTSKGRAVQNLINIEPDDKIRAFINIKDITNPEYINNNYIILCTRKGTIKKTSLAAYSRPRQNGVNAITIHENDTLIEARLTNGDNEIMLAVRSGKAIRFHEKHARAIGRTASGVRGITLQDENDELVGMICVGKDNSDILVVSANGYGKRSKIDDYRITNRGGKGVKTINITDKTGPLVAIKSVTDKDDLMIITQAAVTIRVQVSSIRMTGRAAQGVKLINLRDDDAIASVARVEVEDVEVEDVEVETSEVEDNMTEDMEQNNEEEDLNLSDE